MSNQLPTLTSAQWTVAGLHDSLVKHLSANKDIGQLRLFAYAVTIAGWEQLETHLKKWRDGKTGRSIIAYVGTDHALTDPDALRAMQSMGVDVRLMVSYIGIFHPKVIWLRGDKENLVWVGSNNLTHDGLIQNIEFSTLIKSIEENPELARWFSVIHSSSRTLTDLMLKTYEKERREFAKKRSETGTFTSGLREEPLKPTPPSPKRSLKKNSVAIPPILEPQPGDLIIEITPRETGQDGKQVQLPLAAVSRFFRLENRRGASRTISLRRVSSPYVRQLTLTVFENDTSRLSINDLDYRDRPCVVVFRRTADDSFDLKSYNEAFIPNVTQRY
ncbi:MAG: phospholipase D family protein [Pirellulaceae bacterium]|nr:phospholipase D family protein [Pirellulaceae bacterium]